LGGTKLKYEEVNGRTDFVPQDILNPSLKRVTIGTSLIDSETSNIIPIHISTENIDGVTDKDAIFCDTPGFKDTRGAEVDISNGIAIRKCIESCHGIKPVVIISSQLGPKLELLRDELASVLSSMFLNFEKDIKYFTYVYTNYKNEKQVKEILKSTHISLKDRNENNETSWKAFEILIADMYEKAFKNSLILIDPIDGDREESLSKILLSNYFMRNLQGRISDSLSSKSQDKLEKQINKHFQSIKNSIEKFDYNLTIYKLDQLAKLKDILNKSEINRSFEAVIRTLIENFHKQFNNKNQEFKNKIQKNILFSDLEVNDLMMFMKNIKNSDKLFKYVDDNTDDKIENKFELLKKNLCDVFTEYLNELIKKGVHLEAENIAIGLDNLKKLLENFKELDKENEDFLNVYKNIKAGILDEIQKLYEETKAAYIKDKDFDDLNSSSEVLSNDGLIKRFEIEYNFQFFENLSDNLKKLKNLNETLENHFDKNSLCYSELQTSVSKMILDTSTRFDYALVKKNEEEIIDNIDEMKTLTNDLNDTCSYFKSAVSCTSLHEHIQVHLIEEFQKEFKKNLINYFESLLNISNEQIRHLAESQLISSEPISECHSLITK
jgi:hypothetical protein